MVDCAMIRIAFYIAVIPIVTMGFGCLPNRGAQNHPDSAPSESERLESATKDQQSPLTETSGFDLRITNNSPQKIYPTVESGRAEENFGVVAAHTSKTTGFSPFKLGDEIRVTWSEGRLANAKETHVLSSAAFRGVRMRTLDVLYVGGGKWQLRALDDDDHEIPLSRSSSGIHP
jgi:hypothetical protein